MQLFERVMQGKKTTYREYIPKPINMPGNKWCPMVRGINGCTHTFAGGLENIPNTCIANRCMMWRWADPVDNPGEGYCGLGGYP
jgi:hypothetical protein